MMGMLPSLLYTVAGSGVVPDEELSLPDPTPAEAERVLGENSSRYYWNMPDGTRVPVSLGSTTLPFHSPIKAD
jgi:hypothetical protein